MDIPSLLGEKKTLVERALKAYLPAAGHAPALLEAMHYSVFSGGKRFRPILTLLTFEACGGQDPEWALPAACGIEFIHTYSLIHDDLPCMDNDDFRRGKPTAHQVFGEAAAILAGDALFSLAFELFTRGGAPVERKFRVIREIAVTTGPEGIVGGQMTDIDERKGHDPWSLRRLHLNKTAKFIASAMNCGAILAGATPECLRSITRTGICLGMVFQITDDVLDITAPRERLGKTAQKDLAQNRLTYPKLYGLAGARFRAQKYVRHARAHSHRLGDAFKSFSAIADFLLDRRF